MSRHSIPLENVRVAAPCSAAWEQMMGDERTRFCGQCQLNVYNLSGMTRQEAVRLIANREGRLCVRFYRRADGTILTKNCPVGLAALKRRVSRLASAALSAVMGFFSGLGIFAASLPAVPREGLVIGAMVLPEPVMTMGEIPALEPSDNGEWMAGGITVLEIGREGVRETPRGSASNRGRRSPGRSLASAPRRE